MSLDPAVKALLDQLAANPAPKIWEGTPAEGRAMFQAMSQALDPQGVAIAKTENMTAPGPAGDIPVRIYTPMGGGTVLPGLVYFHGGGWVIGDLQTHEQVCRMLANESGARVVAVDYRLAPEHKFPAAVDDCFAATQWVEEQASALGIDPNRLAVAGDSAGGNLAAVVCQLAKQKGSPKIVFQLLIYPVTEARAKTASMRENAEGYFLEKAGMDWFFDQYLSSCEEEKDPRVSPLLASDLSGLPRAYVITAGYDPLRDEGKAYADKLNRAGVAAVHVNYDGLVHGFFNMTGVVPAAAEAVAAAGKAVREALG